MAGEQPAQQRLFEVHRAGLLEEARRSGRMRFLRAFTTEEDLVGEVFLRAIGSGLLTRLEDRGSGSLRKTLSRFLGFVLNDACRRHGALKRQPPGGMLRVDSVQRTRQERSGHPLMHDAASNWTTPTEQARARELAALCRRLLGTQEWEVWRLVELEGFTSPEVGRRLGISDSAVRGVLRRARLRLIERLGPRNDR